MNDMPSIDSAPDPRADFKASERQALDGIMSVIRDGPSAETLPDVRARVVDLDAELKAAWQEHYKKFPGGRSSDQQRASLASVQKIEFALKDARQRAAQLETAARMAELVQSKSAARTFEIVAPDGRRLRQSALNADLRKRLSAGYEIVAEVFPGGITRPIELAQPTFFDGFIAAFGPQLLLWLSENGIRRDA